MWSTAFRTATTGHQHPTAPVDLAEHTVREYQLSTLMTLSMSVLKGAAASVLYGSRAANGVVLITTKSGAKNTGGQKDFEINFNGSYSIETIASLPEYQNTYGQGNNFMFSGSNGSWGAAFTEGATMAMYAAIAAEYPDLALQLYPDLGG